MPRILAKTIEWIGGHELTVLLGLCVIVVGTWGFIALAGEVLENDTQAIDERILLAMRKTDGTSIGPPWLAEVGRDITALGGYAVLTLVTVAVVGFLRLDRKRAAMWFVVAAIVSGYGMNVALKALVDRERPSQVEHLSYVDTPSFPSGHSMMSAIVYLTLGALLTRMVTQRRLKFYFLAVAVLLSGMVGVSRVFMGVHYPSDVLAGWTAGLVWATLCWLAARAFQRRGTIEQEL